MCLTLKLLQIQPDKEIVVEYIKNEDYKYVRLLGARSPCHHALLPDNAGIDVALRCSTDTVHAAASGLTHCVCAGAFYLRLVGRPIEVYQYLEPLYNDYRKLRLRTAEGNFELSHVDEVIDKLIVGDYLFDISLPHIPSRWAGFHGLAGARCQRVLRCAYLETLMELVVHSMAYQLPSPACCGPARLIQRIVCRWALEQTNPNLGPWISALDEQFDEEAIAQEADLVAARAAALEDEMAKEAAAARCACMHGLS